LAGLLPTVIWIACWYTLCDIILLFQIYFYRWAKGFDPPLDPPNSVEEHSHLLDDHAYEGNVGPDRQRLFTQYAAATIFVFATGVISWWISTQPQYDNGTPPQPEVSEWKIQVIGWTSAALYLGSRVPQIFKNFRTKCEGLSPGLFVFAISGNCTYALSITAASMDRQYLLRNGSWLAGSVLTIFFDIFVLCQFFHYHRLRPSGDVHGAFIAES